MQSSITIAAVVSSVSFLLYGASLFGSRAMVAEFERYQLAPYRTLTGALEIAAGAGLLTGLRFRPLLLISAGGLAGMMLGAIVVRIRVRDPLLTVIPALLLLCLNVFILLAAAR
ncbi:MAG: DoxX family protein [Gemmatimonadaceae bacterium]